MQKRGGGRGAGQRKKKNHVLGLLANNYFYIRSMTCSSKIEGTTNVNHVIKLLFLSKKKYHTTANYTVSSLSLKHFPFTTA